MSSRISSIFSKFQSSVINSNSGNEKKPSNDETTSVVSEISATEIASSEGIQSWKSMINSFSSDSNIDEHMKNLYIDPDILERNCILSAKGILISSLDLNDSEHRQQRMRIFAVSQTCNSVVNNLPVEYFEPHFDPIELILLEVSDWRVHDMPNNFMQRIEQHDIDKDFIVSKLTDAIKGSYHELNKCLGDIYFINTDLLKAEIQISAARRNISIAQTKLKSGALKIVKLQQQQENIIMIKQTLQGLHNMKGLYKLMLNNITVGDFSRAADSACHVLNCFSEGSYSKFLSLQQISTDIQKSLVVLRQKLDKALNRICCRKFISSEYESIIQAYATLDYINEVLGYESADYTNYARGTSDALGCISGLSRRISFAMIDDVQVCVRNAILETICDSNIKKHHVSLVTGVQGEELNEIAELSELENSDLLEKITPELVVPFVCRSICLFCDILHTRFLITQWHKTPFDARNNDLAFLHTNFTEFSDFIKQDATYSNSARCNDSSSSSRVHVHSTIKGDSTSITTDTDTFGEKQKVLRYSDYRLNSVYHNLMQSNAAIWDEIEETLVEILMSVNMSSAISFEDNLALIWAANTITAFGYKFCQSSSVSLINALNEKTREYFNRQHIESYHVLRQMIDNESWLNIPLKLDEFGGVLGIIRKYLVNNKQENIVGVRSMRGLKLGLQFSYPSSESVSSTEEVPHVAVTSSSKDKELHRTDEVSIFETFLMHGNPFHFESDSLTSSNRPLGDSEETAGSTNEQNTNNSDGNHQPTSVSAAYNDGDIFSDLMNADEKSQTKRSNNLTSVVVTQTAMNGLAKYTAKYIQFMSLMPSAAEDAFKGLCELFDYYICAVFVTFVPADERNKLLTKSVKMALPPPDQAKDFDSLIMFLHRALNEEVHAEYIPSEFKPDNSSSSSVHQKNNELQANEGAEPDSDDDDHDHDNHQQVSAENEMKQESSGLDSSSSSSTSTSTHDLASTMLQSSSDVMASATSSVSSSFRHAYSATKSLTGTLAPSNSFRFSQSVSLGMPSSSMLSSSSTTATTEGNMPPSSAHNIMSTSNSHSHSHSRTPAANVNRVSSFFTVNDVVHSSQFDSGSMYGLDMKVVAAESCWFTSIILCEIKPKLLHFLPGSLKDTVTSTVEKYQVISDQLRSLVYRTMTPDITKSKTVRHI